MRVVAGSARGRRLVAPDGTDVRPTGDRVRESIFNALGSLDAIVDATVVDLFAGTGALGIEALSRGAARCTFVDRSGRSLAAVEANVDACGFRDVARWTRADAIDWCATATPVDLALCDPPYSYDDWPRLLEVLPARLVVIESDREVELPAGWGMLRDRRYGGTVVRLAERQEPGS